MKIYMYVLSVWFIALSFPTGIAIAGEYSIVSAYTARGEIRNSNNYGLESTFDIVNASVLLNDGSYISIDNVSATMPFKVRDNQDYSSYRVINPVFTPFFYEFVAREWEEHYLDGDMVHSTRGSNPLILFSALWVVSGVVVGSKEFYSFWSKQKAKEEQGK